MGDDSDEWNKLSTLDKVQNNHWKCRKLGYEELTKSLAKSMEGDAIFKKYVHLVKKFVVEQNELSRMVAVEVALKVVENLESKDAGKITTSVIDGIIQKCFNTKPKTKETAIEICLQFVEHEKGDEVAAALIEGSKNKNPKVATACVEALKLALENFGHKIISLKPAFAHLPKLFQHRDKLVRSATRDFFVEAYCWVGVIVKNQLEKENKIELCIKECEELWVDKKTKTKQKRFYKSQAEQREKAAAVAEGIEEEDDDDEEDESTAVDVYDMLPETKILPALSQKFKVEDEETTFYDGIDSKKWKLRGAALDLLNKSMGLNITSLPDEFGKINDLKLSAGDYGNLATALKTCVKKDTNVLLLIKVFCSVACLCKGLREKFKNYAPQTIVEILGRFKEKKPNVVKAGRMAVDACALTIKFPDQVLDTLIERLADKNPSIRAETTLFVTRNIQPKAIKLSKPTLKELLPKIIANIEHSDKVIRENTYKCLAIVNNKIGAKIMSVFTVDLKDDKKKLIEEAIEELKNSAGDPGAGTTKTVASPKKEAPTEKVVKKTEKPAVQTKGTKKKAPTKKTNSETVEIKEAEITEDAAVDLCIELFGEIVVKEVQNSGWKVRLEHLEMMKNKIALLNGNIPSQAIFRLLSLKPGFKDTNFQCNMEKFRIIQLCGHTANFSETSFNIVLDYCLDKISDVKCGALSQEALNCMAEYLSLPFVISKVLPLGEKLKNVKNVAEIWSWVSQSVLQFGFGKLDIMLVSEASKKAIVHTNANVRTKAIDAIVTLMRFLPKLKDFYAGERDAIQKQIDEAYQKFAGEAPPAPTRGTLLRAATQTVDKQEDVEEEEEDMDDLLPRTNISDKITDEVLSKLGDTNWKMRREALDEIKTLFETNKFITPDLGHLPPALGKRLTDVNKVLLTTTIEIWILVAASLGAKGARQHIKAVLVPMIGVLADSKAQLREKAAAALSSWLELVPMKLWFDDESISEVLADVKKVHLRATFLTWLGEKLKDQKKVPVIGLEACLKHVYICLEDRDGKVRSAASSSLFGFMLHVGWQKMSKVAGNNQKLRDELDKIKETLPKVAVKVAAEVIDADAIMNKATKSSGKKKASPAPEASPATESEDEMPKKEGKKPRKKKTATKTKTIKGKPVVVEELGDIIIGTEKMKAQRDKEDVKLKTLKWTFDVGTVPRDELIEQLKTQCQIAFGAKFLEFFHKTDGPSQLKVIGILEQEKIENVVTVLDLLIRWITIRFGEKNTTVLNRLLTWLQKLFVQLNEADYRMDLFEAYAVLPHLVCKLGESRQEVRDIIHDLLRRFVFLYSYIKIFEEVLVGAKSKNSRCRTECLKHCGEMIEKHGMEALGPPKQMALKEIAAQISDRDQNVRSGALNALVEVYKHIGDEVYNHKKIGRLGEKEESYLRERIKRAGGVASDETKNLTKVESKCATFTRKKKRNTFTVIKGVGIKREDTVLIETPDEVIEEAEAHFKLDEPPPCEIPIPVIEPSALDAAGLLHDIQPLNFKSKKKDIPIEVKTATSLNELRCEIGVYSNEAPKIVQDIKMQLASGDIQRICCALLTASRFTKRKSRLDIEVEIPELLVVISKLYDQKVNEMLLNVEESDLILKVVTRASTTIGNILKTFPDCIDAATLAIVTGSILRLLAKKSFNSQCQSVDTQISPFMHNIITYAFETVSMFTVITAMLKLSHEMIVCADEPLLRLFVRAYFKAVTKFEKSSNIWTTEEFRQTYDALVNFVTLHPKKDPIYETKSKLDILRCHVTFCNLFVRRFPAEAQLLVNQNDCNNCIHERILKELANLKNSEEKENEEIDPTRVELQRLVRKASESGGSLAAIKEIYNFKQRNPDFNITSVLSEQNKYVKLYIERRLEILAFNQANNIDGKDISQTEHNATYYADNLAIMREKAGLAPLFDDTPMPLVTNYAEEVEAESVPSDEAVPVKKRMSADELNKLRERLNKLRK